MASTEGFISFATTVNSLNISRRWQESGSAKVCSNSTMTIEPRKWMNPCPPPAATILRQRSCGQDPAASFDFREPFTCPKQPLAQNNHLPKTTTAQNNHCPKQPLPKNTVRCRATKWLLLYVLIRSCRRDIWLSESFERANSHGCSEASAPP